MLCEYLKPLGISPSLLFSLSKSQTDTVLEKFIDTLHSRKKKQKSALSIGKHAVLFVQIVKPRLRFQLKAVWASLKAWEEQEPSQLRAPIPLPVLLGVLCQARMTAQLQDNPKERVKLLRFSALVGLGYFGLLRPGELLKLRKEDVDLPNQLTFGAPCILLFESESQRTIVSWVIVSFQLCANVTFAIGFHGWCFQLQTIKIFFGLTLNPIFVRYSNNNVALYWECTILSLLLLSGRVERLTCLICMQM